MNDHSSAFSANKALWNAKVPFHIGSKMYAVEEFVAGAEVLSALEREYLGEVRGQRILHLQCHFGQDTLQLARMGALVTGLDISDAALAEAHKLAERCGLQAEWVLSNVLDAVPALDGRFDTVFASFGTIGWLPELGTWAANIRRYLKPGGRLVFVEFHPAVWMFDNAFTHVAYSYFNREAVVEKETGTYADREAPIELEAHSWNHDLGEVLSALLAEGFALERFTETDGSPHNCFSNTVQGSDGLYRIAGMEGKLPLVYGLVMRKPA